MDPTDIPLFALADRRMAWLDQRMTTLAGNVANADTPGFLPRDVTPFAQTLAGMGAVEPARTSPMHLSGTLPTGAATRPTTGERAPDGNAVSLDTQMLRLSETDAAHDLVGELYKKYMAMFKVAAGR